MLLSSGENVRVLARMKPLPRSEQALLLVDRPDENPLLHHTVDSSRLRLDKGLLRQVESARGDQPNRLSKTEQSANRHGVWQFDKVLEPELTNALMFEFNVRQYVDSAMESHEACVLITGSEKSGKTYAAMGRKVNAGDNPGTRATWDAAVGIVPRAIDRIFEAIEAKRFEHYTYRVSISIVDVLANKIRDIGKWGSIRKLGIHEDDKEEFNFKRGKIQLKRDVAGSITASDVLAFETTDRDEMLEFLYAAMKKRQLSDEEDAGVLHTCVSLHITRVDRHTNAESTGVLHLVQMASVHGLTAKRASKPKSLKTDLVNVINLLGQPQEARGETPDEKGLCGYLYDCLHLNKTRAKLQSEAAVSMEGVVSTEQQQQLCTRQTFVLLLCCVNPSVGQFSNSKEVMKIVCGVRERFRAWYTAALKQHTEVSRSRSVSLAARRKRIAEVSSSSSGVAGAQQSSLQAPASSSSSRAVDEVPPSPTEQELRALVQELKRENGALRAQIKRHALVDTSASNVGATSSFPSSKTRSAEPSASSTVASAGSLQQASSAASRPASSSAHETKVLKRSAATSHAVAAATHSERQAKLQRRREEQQIQYDRLRLQQLVLENKSLAKSVVYHEEAVRQLKHDLDSTKRELLVQLDVVRNESAAKQTRIQELTAENHNVPARLKLAHEHQIARLKDTHAAIVASYDEKLQTVSRKLEQMTTENSQLLAVSSDTVHDVNHARKQWMAEEQARRELLQEKLEHERDLMKLEVEHVRAERDRLDKMYNQLHDQIQDDVEATLTCCHLLKQIVEYAATEPSFGLLKVNPEGARAIQELVSVVTLPHQQSSFIISSETRSQNLELAVAALDDCMRAIKGCQHAAIVWQGDARIQADSDSEDEREQRRRRIAEARYKNTREPSRTTNNLLEYVTGERDRYRSASIAEKKKQMSLLIALKSTERLLAQTKEDLNTTQSEVEFLKSPDWSSKALSSFRSHGRSLRSPLAPRGVKLFTHRHNATPESLGMRSPARPSTTRSSAGDSLRHNGRRGFGSTSPRFTADGKDGRRPFTAETIDSGKRRRQIDPVKSAREHHTRGHSAGKMLNRKEFFSFNSVWARNLSSASVAPTEKLQTEPPAPSKVAVQA